MPTSFNSFTGFHHAALHDVNAMNESFQFLHRIPLDFFHEANKIALTFNSFTGFHKSRGDPMGSTEHAQLSIPSPDSTSFRRPVRNRPSNLSIPSPDSTIVKSSIPGPFNIFFQFLHRIPQSSRPLPHSILRATFNSFTGFHDRIENKLDELTEFLPFNSFTGFHLTNCLAASLKL